LCQDFKTKNFKSFQAGPSEKLSGSRNGYRYSTPEETFPGQERGKNLFPVFCFAGRDQETAAR